MALTALGVAPLVLYGFLSPTESPAPASFEPLKNAPTFSSDTALLLTDGTVMVHANDLTTGNLLGDWYRLTPDEEGSYVNGTWSQLASMPTGYAPLYFASAVLPDGRVFVQGGEYNANQGQAETTLGAIYDPVENSWTSLTAPTGWQFVGDANSVVLGDGTLMLANAATDEQALFDPIHLSWTATGKGKNDLNSEETWTLLPSGEVLTVDVTTAQTGTNDYELYDPKTGSWTTRGTVPVALADVPDAQHQYGYEIGPMILRPDGTVFAMGASGHTATYHPRPTHESGAGLFGAGGHHTDYWEVGPDFPLLTGDTACGPAPAPSPCQIDTADAPAALFPNGHVLVAGSPGDYNPPLHMFEYNGRDLTEVSAPSSAPGDSSYFIRMLPLPTGQVLWLDGSTVAGVYTSPGTYRAEWAPQIEAVPTKLARGKTYLVRGLQFNGLSQANSYGDDDQASTNYPLVRITNLRSGHVFYARTHHHSTMAVATGSLPVSTQFDVPAKMETGKSLLAVVANGIPSPAVHVTVQ